MDTRTLTPLPHRCIEAKNDQPVVGWGGSPTHHADFEAAAKGLQRFWRSHPEIVFRTLGHDQLRCAGVHLPPAMRAEANALLALMSEAERQQACPMCVYVRMSGCRRAEVAPWTSSIDEYHRALLFDVGIAPLAPVPFNEAKSSLKALEYAALGIPVVASDWGPYSDFVRHGQTGFIVPFARDGDWKRHLSALVADEQLRIEMGEAAREQARAHTIEGNAWRWEETYLGLV